MNSPMRITREKKRNFPESYDLQTLRHLARKGVVDEKHFKNDFVAQRVIRDEKEKRKRERERQLLLLEIESELKG